jgi:hypothetical protein
MSTTMTMKASGQGIDQPKYFCIRLKRSKHP